MQFSTMFAPHDRFRKDFLVNKIVGDWRDRIITVVAIPNWSMWSMVRQSCFKRMLDPFDRIVFDGKYVETARWRMGVAL